MCYFLPSQSDCEGIELQTLYRLSEAKETISNLRRRRHTRLHRRILHRLHHIQYPHQRPRLPSSLLHRDHLRRTSRTRRTCCKR